MHRWFHIHPSIMLLINTKSYSCCTRPALERILMVKMTPSQNRYFQNSLNFSSVRMSVSQIFQSFWFWLLPIWPGSVELEPLRLRVFALCHDDQPKWQQVEYKALLQEWLWMLQRFPSWDTSTPFSHNCGWRTWETFGEPLFWEPLFSDYYFRFGLGKSQAFSSIEKNDKGAKNIILYVSRMKIRWVIWKGSR